ncbi:MAG TPA: hypothetical protein VFU36_12035 [Jatrophihabitans sp.]|nr:hypothetical protein [Jatrophihabitans sp.]
MNLLGDLLYNSPLIDEFALQASEITLKWLAEIAEEPWAELARSASGLPTAPRLSSILNGLSGHPLERYVEDAYLPIIGVDRWQNDFAPDPDAPYEQDAETWVEFLPAPSGDYGVLLPESSTPEFELALFHSPPTNRELPLWTVRLGLGRRLRGKRVSVEEEEDGCGMATSGHCVSDGSCSQDCQKRRCTGRYGEAMRCRCPEADRTAAAAFAGAGAYEMTASKSALAEA